MHLKEKTRVSLCNVFPLP
jgi:transcription elongation factor SPT5